MSWKTVTLVTLASSYHDGIVRVFNDAQSGVYRPAGGAAGDDEDTLLNMSSVMHITKRISSRIYSINQPMSALTRTRGNKDTE